MPMVCDWKGMLFHIKTKVVSTFVGERGVFDNASLLAETGDFIPSDLAECLRKRIFLCACVSGM